MLSRLALRTRKRFPFNNIFTIMKLHEGTLLKFTNIEKHFGSLCIRRNNESFENINRISLSTCGFFFYSNLVSKRLLIEWLCSYSTTTINFLYDSILGCNNLYTFDMFSFNEMKNSVRQNSNVNFIMLSLSAALRYKITFHKSSSGFYKQITRTYKTRRTYVTLQKKRLNFKKKIYKRSSSFSFCSCLGDLNTTFFVSNNVNNKIQSYVYSNLCRNRIVSSSYVNNTTNKINIFSLVNTFDLYSIKKQLYLISYSFIRIFFFLQLFKNFIFRFFSQSSQFTY